MNVRKLLLICALAWLAASPSRSADTAEKAIEKPIDAALLEFLGSLDGEESGWHDYLEQDAVKAAARVPAKAPKAAAPTTPVDAKQVKSK